MSLQRWRASIHNSVGRLSTVPLVLVSQAPRRTSAFVVDQQRYAGLSLRDLSTQDIPVSLHDVV